MIPVLGYDKNHFNYFYQMHKVTMRRNQNLKQMFEKCPRILRECLTEREYKNFVDEFLIDIRATVIAMEDICPIAKKNTLGEKVNKIRI